MTDLALAPQDKFAPPMDAKSFMEAQRNQKILAYCNARVEQCRESRLAKEKQWHMNLAFYDGRQNVQWTTNRIGNSLASLKEPAAPPWRVRLVINKVKPTIRTEMAKLLKEKPRGYVVPQTSEESDILAARAGDRLIDYFEYDKKIMAQIEKALFWTLTTGNGFIKHWYDPAAMDANGNPGDAVFDVPSPFHILVPDLMELDIQNQPFLIHQSNKDPDWVYAMFGVRMDGEQLQASSDTNQQKYVDSVGLNQLQGKYIPVYEGWFKPSAKFPQGAMITWIKSQILNIYEGQVYKHGKYPFSHIYHIPTGQFYRESTIKDLLPVQREYNRTRSQIIEAKNRMSKPQLVAAKGSIESDKLTSEPGQIILYTPGFPKPEVLTPSPLPHYISEELQRLSMDWQDISGQHEISNGGVPSGVTAATAISFLQEEDDSKLSHTSRSIELATENINRQLLSYVVEFWDLPRTIKVVGANTAFEAFQIKNSDLKGNTDYRVEQGSAIPKSRAAKQAFLMELAKMGALPFDKMLRYMDMAETGKLYEEMQLDSRQAQRESLQIANIKPEVDPMTGMAAPPVGPPVNTFDNHIAHIIEHDNYRKSESFEVLTPEQKQAFETHVMTHKLQLASMYGQNFMTVDPMTGQQTVNPMINGFIYSLMSGQTPPMIGQPSQQQSMVQDAAAQ